MRATGAVLESQAAYRALLRATASPGEAVVLPGPAPYAETLLRTLLDHEVAFCAVGPGAREAAERLSRATGAPRVSVAEADFLLVLGGGSGRMLPSLGRGTLENPEAGATAVYGVEEISERGPIMLLLSGPGVPGQVAVGVEGLTEEEVCAMQETRADYPLGVDVYLVDCGGNVVGLPRSTRIEVVR